MKRFLSMILIGCMVMLMASAAMAEAAPAPSIEDILNDYHAKAFAAQNGGAGNASRSGSGMTPEQEAIEELAEAGYTAYNVTADNYDALQESLKTDFSELGLDPEGSYIIVISGEDDTSSGNPNSRVGSLPEYDHVGGGGDEIPTFTYTYNAKTYTMRYVTVTAADNNALGLVDDVNLLKGFDVDDAWNVLNLPISILSSLGLAPTTGIIYSLVSSILPETDTSQFRSMIYQGGTNWTIKYLQVYNSESKSWQLSACTEYVTMRYFITNTYYEPSTNQYESKSTSGSYPTLYSTYYYDNDLMKDRAAYAYENDYHYFDKIEFVKYQFNGEDIITHYRWSEYLGYEPADCK